MAVGSDSTNLGGTPFIATRAPGSSTWTVLSSSATFDPANGLFSVAKAGGVWVLGSDSNAVAGSQIGFSNDNGVTITLATNPDPEQSFLAVGGSSVLALLSISTSAIYSNNGAAWAGTDLAGPGSYVVGNQGIAFGNGVYAICGNSTSERLNFFSADGIHWTSAAYLSGGGHAIIYDGTQFVQAGQNISNGYVVAVSTDGNNFTESGVNLPRPPLSIAFNGETYVAFGSISSVLVASNTISGLSSAAQQTVATGSFTAITADRSTGLFLAVDDAGFAYSSLTGAPDSWTQETTGASALGLALTAVSFG